jgi:hypothetical protein
MITRIPAEVSAGAAELYGTTAWGSHATANVTSPRDTSSDRRLRFLFSLGYSPCTAVRCLIARDRLFR